MDWKESALVLLERSLYPVPQELNEIDWKGGLSDDKTRLAQHLCAFSNLRGGGYLVYGVNNDASFSELSKESIEEILKRLDNIAQNRLNSAIQLEHAVMEYDGFPLLFVHVPEIHEKPNYLRGSNIYDCYTRSAGHTQKMSSAQVRAMLAESIGLSFEERIALHRLNADEVFRLLRCKQVCHMLQRQVPSSKNEMLSLLESLGVCKREGDLYGITNLGALLFAENIESFSSLKDRRVIVRRYEGTNNRTLLFEKRGVYGYAVGFEGLISYIMSNTSVERVDGAIRSSDPSYPIVAIREFVANALVHQDFNVTGLPVTIEIFSNRLAITNPGYSLNDVNRLIDLPPHSRNENMAQLMLELGLCERRGSGVDRAVDAMESMLLPAYKAESGQDFTRVTIFPRKSIEDMSKEERVAACYQHCCLVYADCKTMNNQSVRDRFGLNKNQSTLASHIISDTIAQGLIKASDPSSESRKFVSYIPYYG